MSWRKGKREEEKERKRRAISLVGDCNAPGNEPHLAPSPALGTRDSLLHLLTFYYNTHNHSNQKYSDTNYSNYARVNPTLHFILITHSTIRFWIMARQKVRSSQVQSWNASRAVRTLLQCLQTRLSHPRVFLFYSYPPQRVGSKQGEKPHRAEEFKVPRACLYSCTYELVWTGDGVALPAPWICHWRVPRGMKSETFWYWAVLQQIVIILD